MGQKGKCGFEQGEIYHNLIMSIIKNRERIVFGCGGGAGVDGCRKPPRAPGAGSHFHDTHQYGFFRKPQQECMGRAAHKGGLVQRKVKEKFVYALDA